MRSGVQRLVSAGLHPKRMDASAGFFQELHRLGEAREHNMCFNTYYLHDILSM
jgi:hypothetical protein